MKTLNLLPIQTATLFIIRSVIAVAILTIPQAVIQTAEAHDLVPHKDTYFSHKVLNYPFESNARVAACGYAQRRAKAEGGLHAWRTGSCNCETWVSAWRGDEKKYGASCSVRFWTVH